MLFEQDGMNKFHSFSTLYNRLWCSAQLLCLWEYFREIPGKSLLLLSDFEKVLILFTKDFAYPEIVTRFHTRFNTLFKTRFHSRFHTRFTRDFTRDFTRV